MIGSTERQTMQRVHTWKKQHTNLFLHPYIYIERERERERKHRETIATAITLTASTTVTGTSNTNAYDTSTGNTSAHDRGTGNTSWRAFESSLENRSEMEGTHLQKRLPKKIPKRRTSAVESV